MNREDRRKRRKAHAKRTLLVETLQERTLMAADLGIVYGPVEPDIQMPAAEVAQASSNSNATRESVIIHRLSDKVWVLGTDYHDAVKVTGAGQGMIKITANTMDDLGNIIGTSEKVYSSNQVPKIVFDGFGGDDSFQNLTNKPIEANGGDGDDYLYSFGHGILNGDDGNDQLRGGRQNDILIGGAGDDRLFGGRGRDYMDGGADDDQLYGGSGRDIMYGRSGNDYLRGDDGNDEMYAGSGNDRMYGKDGNDTMFGDSGVNRMYGGDGNDTMIGGRHRDVMYGQDGDDVVMGQQGSDYVSGGEGNDYLSGGSGNDTLSGGDGRDELFGNNGYDHLLGGDDRDLLDGGDDGLIDEVSGGEGNDIFVRHKAVWLGTDDPDHFRDFDASEADEVFKDYFAPNYGKDFPVPVR